MSEESIKDLNQETNEPKLQEIDNSGVAEENQTFQENISIEQFEDLKKQLEEKTKEADEYKNLCQRVAADFDNYKKRIAKDKENMYLDVVADVVGKILPIIDNFDRALNSIKSLDQNNNEVVKGLEMIKKQIDEVLEKLGIEPIEALNKEFDPYLHNAIVHIEDEKYGKNIVVEELQKGYKIKDRVIRYSLVKVANAY